jgi:hypothetical protein
MLDRFASRVPMRFIRQHDKAYGPAVSSNGLIHAFRLNRKGAAVIIGFAVD